MGRQPNTQCCLCLLSEYLFLSVFCSAQSEQCDTAKRGCSLYPTFFFFLTNYLGRVKYKNILSALFFFWLCTDLLYLIEHDWTEEQEMLQRHKIVLNPISFTSDPLRHQMCEVKMVTEVNYTSFYPLSSPKPNILLHALLACKGHNENTVPLGVTFTIKPVCQ